MKRICICGLLAIALIFGVGLGNTTLNNPVAMANAQDYTINRSSAWYDRPSKTFGAGVTDASGTYFTVAYRLVDMGNDVQNVYESKNSEGWVQIGVLDWNKIASSDVGSPETGGMLFVQVANVAAQSAGYNKMF